MRTFPPVAWSFPAAAAVPLRMRVRTVVMRFPEISGRHGVSPAYMGCFRLSGEGALPPRRPRASPIGYCISCRISGSVQAQNLNKPKRRPVVQHGENQQQNGGVYGFDHRLRSNELLRCGPAQM